MKKKKRTALFMGLMLALSLTACSGRQQTGTTENNSHSQAESESNTTLDNSQAHENSSDDGSSQESTASSDDSGRKNENSSAADDSQEKNTTQAEQAGTSGENARILIAYFSIPEDVDTDGVDAVAGASIVVKDNQKMGNTEYVAGLIQEAVGGDLFRIETQEQYPLDHDPLVDQAAEEQDADARPALETHIENPDQYDTIILGYPNWWGDLPQPLYTFLEEYDFSSKTIIPFVTHGGSGFSNTQKNIAQLQPDAVVSDNTLSLSRNGVYDSREEVIAWAESLGL